MSNILNFFSQNFNGFVWLAVIIISMLPIAEAKVAIPFGMSAEIWGQAALSPFAAGVLSYIGSMIPAIFIILFLRPVFAYLKKTKLFKNIINYLEGFFKSKSKPKSQHKIKVDIAEKPEILQNEFNLINNKINNNYVNKNEKRKKIKILQKETKFSSLLALVFFTALPLPLAGVWTSSAIAAFSEVKFWPVFLAIAFGNLLEVVFITLLCTILIDSIFTVLIFSLILVLTYALIMILRHYIKNKKLKQSV